MPDSIAPEEQIELAKLYFRRVDEGDPALVDMFTEDVQSFFPKYGTAHGLQEHKELAAGLTGNQVAFHHDVSSMVFTQSGNRLVVEGLESGTRADGLVWPSHPRIEGRYCNVFEFRGRLISRLHIYVDPDFAGEDSDRFLWG